MNQWLTQLKELGGVFATLSACGYVSGYLSLRAKAHSLGTNPAFKLVDEAYVFAGFRVLFATLVVLLVSAPVLFAFRYGAEWLETKLTPGAHAALHWLLLLAVIALTLFNLRILAYGGLLLESADANANLAGLPRAILDGTGAVWWIFVTTLLPVVCSTWLLSRIGGHHGPFEWMLGLALALQLCALPIYHGALFADRKARVLSSVPSGVEGLTDPVAIVDQTSEHATLYAIDSTGVPSLTVVALEELKSPRVTKIIALGEFVRELARSPLAAKPLDAVESAAVLTDRSSSGGGKSVVNTQPAKDVRPASAEVNKTFLRQAVELLRITFEGIGSLGESPVTDGQLWEARLDAAGKVLSRRRIGAASDLAWPVGAPGATTFWAIQAGGLVAVKADGSIERSHIGARWRKLVGAAADGSVFGFLAETPTASPAILRSDGTLERGVESEAADTATKLERLRDETRSYADHRTLQVDRSERGGRGFDVYLSANSQLVNVSDCGDDRCGHPSLVRDPDRVIYVRSPRY